MNTSMNHSARGPKSRWQLLPVMAMLAVGFTGLGASSAGAAAKRVPFKASVSGTLTPTSPTTIALAGSGNASHLGKLKSYKGNVVITSGAVGVTNVTDVLTETLTAANGDNLTLLCKQTATLYAGVYHGTDHWTVTGGTGRFKHATGSGTGETFVHLSTSTFTKTSKGTIAY